MRHRKAHVEAENHERWLVSYADFITLLFAFFVVMFASSQADKGKAMQVSESVKKALEGKSLSATVAAILGGTPADMGKGSAQMRGPGGVKRTKENEKVEDRQVMELLPTLEMLTKELEPEI